MSRQPIRVSFIAAILLLVYIVVFPQTPENHPFGIKIRTGENLRSYEDADRLIEMMNRNGVTFAFVLIKSDEEEAHLTSGYLFYPGKTAPVAPGFEEDIMGYFVHHARMRGIRLIAWLPVMKDAQFWQREPDARAYLVTSGGERIPQKNWLSPFAPQTLQHATAVLTEVLARYPFDGVVLDYIRYDDDFATVDDYALQAFQDRFKQPLQWQQLHAEARQHSAIWKQWAELRAEQITFVTKQLLTTARQLRPNLEFGLTLLPFSANGYFKNTVSGQDYARLSRTGVDFISPLGYWDDWYKSPQWMRQVYEGAIKQVEGRCRIIMAVDGDMTFPATAATWEALPEDHQPLFFFYGKWTAERLSMLRLARRFPHLKRLEQLVAIRIDTEPDYTGNWDVPEADFLRLLQLFERHQVKATWVTVGKMAQTHAPILQEIIKYKHEIALHGWAHERFEDLPSREEKRRRITMGLQAMEGLGISIEGFGAPQNSIDHETREILLDMGFLYDASLALDPLNDQWLSVQYFSDQNASMPIIPFVYPNDYDGLVVMKLDAEGLFRAWKERFDAVYQTTRAPFVIDVHQWLIGQPQYLTALDQFIQYVQNKKNVRIVTMGEIARIYQSTLIPPASNSREANWGGAFGWIGHNLWQIILKFLAFFPGILALQYIVFALIFRWVIERRPVYSSQFTPSVAVFVPAHNEADHIKDTLLALAASDYPQMEIIVIDDGSTDDTATIAASVPGVKVIRLLHNEGKAHALNTGLKHTRADIVVCVDADTRVNPSTIRYLVQPFLNPEVAGVTGNPQIRNRTGFLRKLQTMEYATIISLIKRAEALLGGLYTVSGAICAFRRKVLVEAGGWNEATQTEDIEISWRVQKLGYRLAYEPRAVCWISIPGKYRALFRQRIRWSRGSGEVYRKHLKIVGSSNTSTVPIILNSVISSIWALLLVLTAPFIALEILPGLDNGTSVLAINAVLLHLQSLTGLILDSRYNSGLIRYFWLTPLFIVYFWLLILPAFVYGFTRGVRGEQTGVWEIQRA